jgi:hypothetical protein
MNEPHASPNGRHYDQVDSISQELDYHTARAHPLQVSVTPRTPKECVPHEAALANLGLLLATYPVAAMGWL